MIRVFLGLAIFIRMTFELVPSGLGISRSLSTGSLDPFAWLWWVQWGVAVAISWGFIVYAKVGARLPASPPGFGLIAFALVVTFALGAAMTVMFAGVKDMGSILILLMGVMIFAGPISVVADTLLAIGLFKVLFNLEPRDAPDPWGPVSMPHSPAAGPAAGLVASPVALPAAGLAAHPAAKASAQDVAQSIAELRASLAAKPGDPRPHQQLHRLLLADPAQQSEMLAHAREYLAVLVKESRSDEATKVLQECVDKDPAFKPFPDQIVPLAKHAIARDQGMLALRIMNQFDRLNPGHASTPTVYFLSARALRDQKQLAQARQVLDAFLARFPGDPLAVEAKMLREGLERP
jgi:hypothetical protein